MKLKRLTRRSYVILSLTAVLAVLVFAFVFIEVNASRSDLLAGKRAEARTLVEMLARGSQSYMLASDRMEDLLIRHLLATTHLVRHLESHSTLGAESLARIAGDNEISFVALLDSGGRVRVSGIPFELSGGELGEEFNSLKSGESEWITVPDALSPSDGKHYYLLLIASSIPGRYIVAGYRDDVLLEYRKLIGIGALLTDLSENIDIQYVVLQDRDGIVTATRNIQTMEPVETDPFLLRAFNTDSAFTRLREFEGEKSLEAVHIITGQDSTRYLARIGLSLEGVRTIQQRAMQRVILVGAAILVFGVFVLGFLLTRERFATLQEEHRRVKSSTDLIMENIADGVVAIDASGTITFINAIARRMFPSEETLMYGDTLHLQRTLRTGKAIPYIETALSLPGGSRMDIGVSTSIVESPQGGIETVIAIFRDLTEEKRIEEQLRRQERLTALGELAGGVAHEIRNPLNAIGIIAQRLKSEFEPSEDADEYAALTSTVRSEVERVNRIIKQFLDFAKPPKLQREALPLDTVIREAVIVIESQAKNAGVTVDVQSGEAMTVALDRNAFKQALINLFQNALEAMPGGGTLAVRTNKEDMRAVIRIADSGHGMNPDTMSKIFNLYFSTKPNGTGMGLSIVHQLIVEHGGAIAAMSNEGSGTEFTITLPLLNEAPQRV